jgi:hypothetical protein
VAGSTYDYAAVRVVPCVEREEFVNVGVILFCRTQGFLEARIALDLARLKALAPDLDAAEVQAYLALIPRICAGGAAAGPIGRLPQPERFHWLVAPCSTIVQPGPVHSGLCTDPAAALERLLRAMVVGPEPVAPELPLDLPAP